MSGDLDRPAEVPERVVWEGQPAFRGLYWRRFHARWVGAYFVALMLWRAGSSLAEGQGVAQAGAATLRLLPPALAALAVLALLAWLFRRASHYTLTNRHLVLRFGVALPVTMSIPLRLVSNAALRSYADGSGDIPLAVDAQQRVSWLLLWPHIRPWRLRAPEPMLVAVPDAAAVAAKMAQLLGGQPGPALAAARALSEAPAADGSDAVARPAAA
jgi:hypothetical protein